MKKLFAILLSVLSVPALAQLFSPGDYRFSVQKTNEEIIIDGLLTETAWQHAKTITNFWQHYPVDTLRALAPTLVKIMYNEKFLYIGAWCQEKSPVPIIQNLIRDDNANYWSSDGFSVVIDPLNTNQTGYFFGLNAGGAKQDGSVAQQGLQPNLDMYWDNAWYGQVSQNAEGYFYEFAIPFASLKFNPKETTWGFNFIRNDMKRNAFDLWTQFETVYNGLDLLYNGEVKFMDGLPNISNKKLELKPSVSGQTLQNIEGEEEVDFKFAAGLDAKYAVTANLNLDVAILPDFSTVEVDQQYIDFYRYEYKVDEQRGMFLENSDLFASPGGEEDWSIVPTHAYKIKPFYTRRIGIKDWQHTPIVYGARLSGSPYDGLRIGVLNMQTGKYEDDPANNFSAIGFQQRVAKGSSISGLVLNKQAINYERKSDENTDTKQHKFNRNAGLEYDFVSKNGKISSSAMFHRSFSPEYNDKSNFYGAELEFRTKSFRSRNHLYHVDENYVAEMGYVPRLYHYNSERDTTFRVAYSEFSNYNELSFFPGNKIGYWGIRSYFNSYFHRDGLNEIKYQFENFMEFNDRSSLSTSVNYGYFEMLHPNDILKNDKALPAGEYEDLTLKIQYRSSPQNALIVDALLDYGKFYNGRKTFTDIKLIYKAQPWGVFSVGHNLCKLDLPEFEQHETYHLISGRAQVNFSRDISWTTLMQYNTQLDNINFNSLFQWRFAPLSDFFVVIKDDTDLVLNQKKWQIVFKLSYWFKL